MLEFSRRTWYAVIAVLVVAVAATVYLRRSGEPADDVAAAPSSGWGPGQAVARGPASGGGTDPAAWPVTVSDAMGLTLDAARLFELGFAGGLVIDSDTRASIEALVNSMPEEPSEADMARLERTLREGLPKEDADKAFKLIKDYRAYTGEVRKEMEPMGIPGSLQEANAFFDKMESVKRRHFDEATASALFGQHDEHARVTMEAMFVQQDTALTPEQKNERLDALRARLPPDQQSLIPQETAPAPPPASQPSS